MSRRAGLIPEVVRHRTLRSLLDHSEVLGHPPYVQGYSRDGRPRPLRRVTAERRIRAEGCWGFIEFFRHDPPVIHVWWRRGVPAWRLAATLGHEMGHAQLPRKRRDVDEERRAEVYSTVAEMAMRIVDAFRETPQRAATTCFVWQPNGRRT